MVENTKIEWANDTFNGWIGCAKVSPGCEHCYAETLMDTRYGRVEWGVNGTRIRTSEANWRKPLAWNRAAEKEGVRRRVFCSSLSDVFEDREELIPWRADLFDLILKTPHLDWMLLTKRPENAGRMMGPEGVGLYAYDRPHPVPCPQPNIWIGTSVENQEQANKRIPELLEIPATVRFLSMEPLLGLVSFVLRDIPDWDEDWKLNCLTGKEWASPRDDDPPEPNAPKIDWVIVGGESGPNARPMHPDWARSIRDQCQVAGVAFHFKQWGEYGPEQIGKVHYTPVNSGVPMSEPTSMFRVGKKLAGRLLDGRTWDEFPSPQCVTPSTDNVTGG